MWIRFIALLLLWHSGGPLYAGVDSLHIAEVRRIDVNISSSVLSGNIICTLDDSGHIALWDLNRMDTLHLPIDNIANRYTAICKDSKGNFYFADVRRCIFRIDSADHSISFVMRSKYTVYDLCVNSEGRILTQSGAIYDPVSDKHWTGFDIHNTAIRSYKSFGGLFDYKVKTDFLAPGFCYLDRRDYWWMCVNFGEWGGEVEVFDTRHSTVANNNFAGIDKGLFFPKSLFEDDLGNLYITSGIQHMGGSGYIYRLDRDKGVAVKIFDSYDYGAKIKTDTDRFANFFDDGLFVGPGTYHSIDSSIYFATNQGIYKGKISPAGGLATPVLYLKIRLPSASAELAAGNKMAVTSLHFAGNGKLVMTTLRSGICVYDGTYLTFMK